jgi:hypothetical protein
MSRGCCRASVEALLRKGLTHIDEVRRRCRSKPNEGFFGAKKRRGNTKCGGVAAQQTLVVNANSRRESSGETQMTRETPGDNASAKGSQRAASHCSSRLRRLPRSAPYHAFLRVQHEHRAARLQ